MQNFLKGQVVLETSEPQWYFLFCFLVRKQYKFLNQQLFFAGSFRISVFIDLGCQKIVNRAVGRLWYFRISIHILQGSDKCKFRNLEMEFRMDERELTSQILA